MKLLLQTTHIKEKIEIIYNNCVQIILLNIKLFK